jgi:hypothetical protein
MALGGRKKKGGLAENATYEYLYIARYKIATSRIRHFSRVKSVSFEAPPDLRTLRAERGMLCSCAPTGTQAFSPIPLRIEEVGRKLYLSETPSIGWEAKHSEQNGAFQHQKLLPFQGLLIWW